MIIGYGNGDYFRIYTDPFDRFTPENIEILKYKNCKAIEIHCQSPNMVDYLNNHLVDLNDFSYLSLHTPRYNYSDNEETRVLLNSISKVVNKYHFHNIVLHPDTVVNWNVFKEYEHLPFSIENMDHENRYGHSINQLENIIEKIDFQIMIDLQHCYMLDPTMRNAIEMQKRFKDLITQYHISGYRNEGTHYPLYKTQQDIIIESLLYPEKPIVIESTFDEWGEHERELEYIIERLK